MFFSLLRALSYFILIAVGSSTGVYYIDDTDPSITWTGPFVPLNESFEPITWADASKCYNKTFTVGEGTSAQGNQFRLPFKGSGVALFVAYNNRLGLNVSITLDNNFTTINWFILDTDYSTPTFTSYNATLYDKQNLTYGHHVLNVVLQDYRGNQSDIMFDYAAITGGGPVVVHSSENNTKKIGAGIGGGLGALAIVVAIAMIIIFTRRRNQRKSSAMELNLIDRDAKDPSVFNRKSSNMTATFRPSHARRHSSFSQSSTSPISPVKPSYSRFFGQKHPFQQLHS